MIVRSNIGSKLDDSLLYFFPNPNEKKDRSLQGKTNTQAFMVQHNMCDDRNPARALDNGSHASKILGLSDGSSQCTSGVVSDCKPIQPLVYPRALQKSTYLDSWLDSLPHGPTQPAVNVHSGRI